MLSGDYSTHFGVYGVNVQHQKLLCIKKNAGPYKNRFGLPGGSQEKGEGLTETLQREFLEETGYTVQVYTNNRVYDAFVKEDQRVVHHIFTLYDVSIDSISQKVIPADVVDGKNDSDGVEWVALTKLNLNNASPIVLKVVSEMLDKNHNLEKDEYINWIVL